MFTQLKTDDKFVLFVNSDTPPHKEVPLDVFSYEDVPSGTKFFQLYILQYKDERDGIAVTYSRYNWEQIQIKERHRQAAKNMIDGCKSLSEFKS